MNYSLTEFVFYWLLPMFTAMGLLYAIVKYHEEEILTPVPVISDRDKLELVSLGNFTHNNLTYDLRHYYVDRQNNLYSRNALSWEINRKNGKDILICSDNSFSKSGTMVNTFRTVGGAKVTIPRHRLSFNKLFLNLEDLVSLNVEKVGNRHLKVTKVGI